MGADAEALGDLIGALDKHKERIRRLQVALCECEHGDVFKAHLHDSTCPVYIVGSEQTLAVLNPKDTSTTDDGCRHLNEALERIRELTARLETYEGGGSAAGSGGKRNV
jgi:hypothetical protein